MLCFSISTTAYLVTQRDNKGSHGTLQNQNKAENVNRSYVSRRKEDMLVEKR